MELERWHKEFVNSYNEDQLQSCVELLEGLNCYLIVDAAEQVGAWVEAK